MSVAAIDHVWSVSGVTAEEKLVLIWIANNSGGLGCAVCPEWIGMGEFACVHFERAYEITCSLADKGLVRWGNEEDGTAHVLWLTYDGPYDPPIDFTWETKTRSKRVAALMDRDGPECVYCGSTPVIYHVDHFVPRARGGDDKMHNLVLACPQCNLAKRDLPPEDFLATRPDLYRKLAGALEVYSE